MSSTRNSYLPLWGGLPSLFGSAWTLYTNSRQGYSPIGWMYPLIPSLGDRAPLRQRVILGDTATNGQSWLDVVAQDEEDLPPIDADDIELPTEAPKDAPPPPQTTWEFAMSPFRLVLRAIPLPVIGIIDVFIQKAKPAAYVLISLVYQSLPLSSITRLSGETRIIKKTSTYKHSPPRAVATETICEHCNHLTFPIKRWALDRTVYSVIRRRCEHQVAPADSTIWGPLNNLSECDAPFEVDVDDPDFRGTPFSCRFDPTEDLTARIGRLLGITDLAKCPHTILDHTKIEPVAYIPESTVDGLYALPPSKIWRKENMCHGIRCVKCFSGTLHSWNPKVLTAIKKFDIGVRTSSIKNLPAQDWINIGKLWSQFQYVIKYARLNFSDGGTYILSACTLDRVDKYVLLDPNRDNVIIVESVMTFDALVEKWPILRAGNNHVLVCQVIGNNISIAGFRLVLAMICPMHVNFIIVNQNQGYYEGLNTTVLENLKIPWSSASIGHAYPFYMGAAYITSGYTHLTAFEVCYLYYTCGFCYGWDEIVPAMVERLTTVLISDTGLPPIMAPLVSDKMPKTVIVNYVIVDSSSRRIGSYVADFSRENLFYMKALGHTYVDEGRVSFAHALADPRPISTVTVRPDILVVQYDEISASDTRFAPSSAPGENIVAEISHTHGGLIIFTFGSRGDRNPLLANAKYMAALGVKVTVIHLNTEAEGLVLADMQNTDELRRIQLFMRAREYIAAFQQRVVWVPHQLYQIGSISYTLAPPEDIIYPFVSSNNVLIAFASALIGLVHYPDIRIGAFASAGCLPTSADGSSFMTALLNKSKPRTEAAYWGGDGRAPPGYEHIPLLPDGDHGVIMTAYDTIYTKGTVGGVARAALSGCKVVVIGEALDREYRNPFDAGNGFVDGQDPDACFLALAKSEPAYFGVWMRSNWYNVKAIWAWYGPENIGLTLFRLLILYLFLSRINKATFFSTMPVTTLILMLDGRATVPFKTMVFYTLLAKVFDTMLWTLSKNYIWLTGRFVSLNSRLMASIVAFWVAQRKGWGFGLLAVLAIEQLKPTLTWLISWVPMSLGISPDGSLPPDDEYAVLEFVFVWSYIPVVHVALVFPHAKLRAEGTKNSFGLYTCRLREGNFHSPFVFPTMLSLSTVRRNISTLPALPYGPTWNCYTVIWSLAKDSSSRLCLGAVPIMLVNLLGAALSATTALALAGTYTVLTTIPALGGMSVRSSGLASLLSNACRQVVELVEQNNGDFSYVMNAWFARLTYLTPLAPREI